MLLVNDANEEMTAVISDVMTDVVIAEILTVEIVATAVGTMTEMTVAMTGTVEAVDGIVAMIGEAVDGIVVTTDAVITAVGLGIQIIVVALAKMTVMPVKAVMIAKTMTTVIVGVVLAQGPALVSALDLLLPVDILQNPMKSLGLLVERLPSQFLTRTEETVVIMRDRGE